MTDEPRLLKMLFESVPWSESHGYSHDSLGAAPLYAVVAKSLAVRDVLVIGSGAGFTPKVFLENVETLDTLILVDAFLAETGNGSPFDVSAGNLDYAKIEFNRQKLSLFKVMSKPFLELAIKKKTSFDLIFIDGDHSIDGFHSDLSLSIRCLRKGGAILFHDTKFDHIREVADELLENRWVNFEIGAGFGVYLANGVEGTRMTNEPLNATEEKMLYEQSMSQRWDYLASDEFKQRSKEVVEMIVKHVSSVELEIDSALEIGGNPAPLLMEIIDLIEINSMVTVEPYISPIAEDTFNKLQLKGVTVVKSVNDIAKINFDLVCVLGIDLSLSKNYNELVSDATIIRNLFERAKLVVTETPNYQPSKWLEKFLTEDLSLIETTNIQINANQKFSINEDILTRQISIWKAPNYDQESMKSLNSSPSELIKYARWHALDDTPRESLNFGQNGYEVQQVFNSWQVELDPAGKSFVWLKTKQSTNFPDGKKELIIHYSQGPRPTIRHNFFIRSEISDSHIILRKRLPLKKLSFTLSSWVPSKMDPKSRDHRELTVAAYAFEFR